MKKIHSTKVKSHWSPPGARSKNQKCMSDFKDTWITFWFCRFPLRCKFLWFSLPVWQLFREQLKEFHHRFCNDDKMRNISSCSTWSCGLYFNNVVKVPLIKVGAGTDLVSSPWFPSARGVRTTRSPPVWPFCTCISAAPPDTPSDPRWGRGRSCRRFLAPESRKTKNKNINIYIA